MTEYFETFETRCFKVFNSNEASSELEYQLYYAINTNNTNNTMNIKVEEYELETLVVRWDSISWYPRYYYTTIDFLAAYYFCISVSVLWSSLTLETRSFPYHLPSSGNISTLSLYSLRALKYVVTFHQSKLDWFYQEWNDPILWNSQKLKKR